MKSLFLFCFLSLTISYTFCQNQIEQETLITLAGNSTSLGDEFDLEKPTIIAFWATWCGPCLKELDAISPKLAEWKTQKDFNFVAITIDDQRALSRVKPMAEGRSWNFPILADPNQSLARKFNVPTPPYTLILENDAIAFSKTGYKPGDEDVLFAQINETATSTFMPKALQIAIESNTSYYQEDDDVELAVDTNKVRTNTYIKADYDFLKNFRATVQLESYEPQALLDYAPVFDGTDFGTYSLNYNNGMINATAGHFYDQWGSGLAFRAFEDRQLGINTAVLGGRLEVRPTDQIAITAIAGKQRLGFDLADSFLYGGNAEMTIFQEEEKSLHVGASALFKNQELEPDASQPHDEITTMLSGRLKYVNSGFYTSLEVNRKSEEPIIDMIPQLQVAEDFLFTGNSIQLSSGYTKDRFGVNGTFRRMEGMNFFAERFLQTNQFNQGVLNYVPALTKQQDYSLMNRYVHLPIPAISFLFDFGDGINQAGEIGGQLDLFYQFEKGTPLGGEYGTNVTVNMSSWHNIEADYDFETRTFENDKLIGFGDKYYSDLNVEIRKRFTENQLQILTFLTQQNALFDDVSAQVIAWEGLFQTGPTQSLRTEAQHMWADTEEKEWWAATAEYSFSPRFSVFAADMYNYGNDREELQYHNYNFGTSYTWGATRADIMYGRRPTGLLCVGGVCRQVTAASGLHLNFSTTLR